MRGRASPLKLEAVGFDLIFNIMLNSGMKTITMVALRTDSERIVKDLRRGVRMTLSYRGKPLAELVPLSGEAAPDPLEALDPGERSHGACHSGAN